MGKLKLPKDPNAPKKPTRPYIYFLLEVRKEVSEEMNKNHDEVVNHHEISKECARRWSALPAEKKQKFHEKFIEDQNRFREAMKSYTPSPDFLEKVRHAKLNNSSGRKAFAFVTDPGHDPNIVKVPHMIRAYFDYMASTWSSVAASHPRYSPGQVQDEIWRRWSQGGSGSNGGVGSSIFDENHNIEKKQPKKRTRKRTALKNPLPRPPRQAFDCYLETLTEEVRKFRPDLSDSEMHKLVSAKWKDMTDVQKFPFFEVERKEKQRYEVQMKKVQEKEVTNKENESKEDPVRMSGNMQNKVVIRPDVADIDEKVAVTQDQLNVSGIKEEKREQDASIMSFDIDDSRAKIPSKEEEKVDVSANEYANEEKSANKNLIDYLSDSSGGEEVEAETTILSTCSGSSDDSSDDDSDNVFIISTPVDQIRLAEKPLPQ